MRMHTLAAGRDVAAREGSAVLLRDRLDELTGSRDAAAAEVARLEAAITEIVAALADLEYVEPEPDPDPEPEEDEEDDDGIDTDEAPVEGNGSDGGAGAGGARGDVGAADRGGRP